VTRLSDERMCAGREFQLWLTAGPGFTNLNDRHNLKTLPYKLFKFFRHTKVTWYQIEHD